MGAAAVAAVVVACGTGCVGAPELHHLELIPVSIATPATLEFSPDGRRLAAFGDGVASLWSIAERKALRLTVPVDRCAAGGSLSRDGSFAWCAGAEQATVWAVPDDTLLAATAIDGARRGALLPDNRLGVSVSSEAVSFWSVPDGELRGPTALPVATAPLAAVGLEGGAAVSLQDGSVLLARPGEPALVLAGPSPSPRLLAAARRGQVLAASGPGAEILFWDASGRALGRLDTEGVPEALTLSADGSRVAYASVRDGRRWLRLRARAGETLGLVETGLVRRLAFSPDGRRLASLLTSKLAIWKLP